MKILRSQLTLSRGKVITSSLSCPQPAACLLMLDTSRHAHTESRGVDGEAASTSAAGDATPSVSQSTDFAARWPLGCYPCLVSQAGGDLVRPCHPSFRRHRREVDAQVDTRKICLVDVKEWTDGWPAGVASVTNLVNAGNIRWVSLPTSSSATLYQQLPVGRQTCDE